MPRTAFFKSVKAISWVVLLLIVAAIAYSVFTSIRYWSGIGV